MAFYQVAICSEIITPAKIEKYFQGLNNSKDQNYCSSIQIMPKKYFTMPEFLTRHFQILQMGRRSPPCTPVSYGNVSRSTVPVL